MGFEVGRIKNQERNNKRAIILMAAIFLLSWQILDLIGAHNWLADKFYLYINQGGEEKRLGLVAGATDWNPSYPRTAYQYPAAETHFTACEDIYMKFDLLGLAGSNVCNKIVKEKKPSVIIFGGFGNMNIKSEDDDINFQHLIFRALGPKTLEAVGAQAGPVDIGVDETAGLFKGNHDDKPDAGEVVIFVGPTKGTPQEGLNYSKLDKVNYSFVDSGMEVLEGVYNISHDHQAGEYLRQPLKAGGWSPNVSDLNPFNQQETIAYFIDNKYNEGSKSFLANVDGILYDFFRSRGTEEEFNNVDFNLNWVPDAADPGGVNGQAAAWQNGLRKMFDYEKQKTGKTKIITNDGFGIPDGAPAWLDGHILEKGMNAFWSWSQYLNKLKEWEAGGKYITAVDGKGASWSDTSNFKNDFSSMRYGLASAAMGNAFYGRTGGGWFYFAYIYDEYLTDLGYPTSEPQKVKCIKRQIDEWNKPEYCVYIRFFDKGAVIVNQEYQPVSITESEIKGLTGYEEGGYYRFKGGQDAGLNNGKRLTDSEPINLTGNYDGTSSGCNGNDKCNKGDGILLFKQDDYRAVADIVVGNFNNNDTSPGSAPLTTTGSWQKRPKTNKNNPYFSQWDQDDASSSSEGIGYFSTTDRSATATFKPTIGLAGEYEVFEWHGWAGNGPGGEVDKVKVEIKHTGGTETKVISQKSNYGKWNSLGKYNFSKGVNDYVKLSFDAGAGGTLLADAIKFVYTENSMTTGSRELLADFNCDGKVDVIDFGILLSHVGRTADESVTQYQNVGCAGKIKNLNLVADSEINYLDLASLLSCWGTPTSKICLE